MQINICDYCLKIGETRRVLMHRRQVVFVRKTQLTGSTTTPFPPLINTGSIAGVPGTGSIGISPPLLRGVA